MVEVVIVELPFSQEGGSEKSFVALTAAHPPQQAGDQLSSAEEASKGLDHGAKVVGSNLLGNAWSPPDKGKVEAVGQTLSYKDSKILAFDQNTGAFAAEVMCWELGETGYVLAALQPGFRFLTGILNSTLSSLRAFESPEEALGAQAEMSKEIKEKEPELKGRRKNNF
ncbi:hypothetical protein [Xanthomonas phaseoli]|uniref:hypothetical protein n=1 Tax=Xanthomonas phaseoli TaxID=1985254 RepID=UPI0012380765|nr:hypothetical protein [Xanthomonas phaseoli]MBO9830969.1 hypothetical protein [Xanthomonas phaseoli pv. dieffenbachiae]MBO9837791.1 hypothetical protein [Xanthomonas phaseoli pv. dieffenbachiae]MBO9841329.1 hypothetical protein [Xanthomonas phaseoli pv. dieffenbachiae]MBO9862279.1 hypothetical protein [Xanthomonas phaseoli pv. dieffenbachiae]MBO9866037.1 hypothetical protein [Xanthomonas phaseoli pv. dieffenbachiae]